MRSTKITENRQALKNFGTPVNTIIDVKNEHSTAALISVLSETRQVLFESSSEYHSFTRKTHAQLSFGLVKTAVSNLVEESILYAEKRTRKHKISHSHLVKSAHMAPRPMNHKPFRPELGQNGF